MAKTSLIGGSDETLSKRLQKVTDELNDANTFSTNLRVSSRDGRMWTQIKVTLAKIGIKLERTHIKDVARALEKFVDEKKEILFKGDVAQIYQNVENLEKIANKVQNSNSKNREKFQKIFDKFREHVNKAGIEALRHKEQEIEEKIATSPESDQLQNERKLVKEDLKKLKEKKKHVFDTKVFAEKEYIPLLKEISGIERNLPDLKTYSYDFFAYLTDKEMQKTLGSDKLGYSVLAIQKTSSHFLVESILNFMVLKGEIAGYRKDSSQLVYDVFLAKHQIKSDKPGLVVTKPKLLEIHEALQEMQFPKPKSLSKEEKKKFVELTDALKGAAFQRLIDPNPKATPLRLDTSPIYQPLLDHLLKEKVITAWTQDEHHYYIKMGTNEALESLPALLKWHEVSDNS